jgi:AraC-like DNA-binding protein
LQEDYLKEIFESGKEKDSFEFQDGENSYYISWRGSSLFGWIYVGKANYSDLLSNFIYYNRIIISSAAFFILLGLLLSIYFMRKIYLPIKEMVSNLEFVGLEEGAFRNEYEILNAAMEGFELNANEMKVTQFRYNQIKRNEIISKLLNGDKYLEEGYREIMKEIGLVLEGPVFCVIRFSFNHYDTIKATNSKTDIDIFSFAVINILEEYLGNRGYGAFGIRDGEGSFCFILQLDEEYENMPDYNTMCFQHENVTEMQKILFSAKTELEKLLKYFTFTVSVGRSVRDYEALHRSYLDTKYANVYRLVRGTEQIILFTEHMENYESRMAYPLNEEKKLLSYIKLLKEDMILLSIEEFFEAILKMSPNETRWSVNQLMLSVLHMIMTLNYKTKDGSPVDWKEWTNQINATDTREEMKEVLKHLLQNLSGEQDSGNGNKSKIANDIKQYVDEHYQEDTLSVTEIASCTGFSTNYVRLIFKNEIGESISDYIQNKRIEKAKELLRTSNHTSKEIAGMVGYTDNRYFYVVFKRITGETADSYRRRRDT